MRAVTVSEYRANPVDLKLASGKWKIDVVSDAEDFAALASLVRPVGIAVRRRERTRPCRSLLDSGQFRTRT
jgi:hypothetical protein